MAPGQWYGTAVRSKNAASRGTFKLRGDRLDTRRARVARQRGELAELRQRRLRVEGPRDSVERLLSATPRQIVADGAKREIVGEHVRPGHQHEHTGHDQQRRVDGEPLAVMLPRVGEEAIARVGGGRVGEIGWMHQRRRCEMTQRPQRPLFGD